MFRKQHLFFLLVFLLIISICAIGSASVYTDKDTVKLVQQALIDAGLYQGKANGKVSADFSQALKSYQQEHGIAASGLIYDEVLDLLLIEKPHLTYTDAFTVTNVQNALKEAGYNPGKINGKIKGSQKAIKAYQAANQMEETGAIDDALLKSLEIDLLTVSYSDPDVVKAVQEALSQPIYDRGNPRFEKVTFYSGKINGKLDKKTTEAVRNYESRLSIPGDGQITLIALMNLGLVEPSEDYKVLLSVQQAINDMFDDGQNPENGYMSDYWPESIAYVKSDFFHVSSDTPLFNDEFLSFLALIPEEKGELKDGEFYFRDIPWNSNVYTVKNAFNLKFNYPDHWASFSYHDTFFAQFTDTGPDILRPEDIYADLGLGFAYDITGYQEMIGGYEVKQIRSVFAFGETDEKIDKSKARLMAVIVYPKYTVADTAYQDLKSKLISKYGEPAASNDSGYLLWTGNESALVLVGGEPCLVYTNLESEEVFNRLMDLYEEDVASRGSDGL